ncbi:MAG: hypothetical protein IJ525_04675 [Alphaproteobacteria bacterium]|nr:hypothetical protein [Alphaproteobacteria bacterium]
MLTFGFILFLSLFYAFPLYANPACAVCTVGVVVGLEVARKLGVDDGVIGIWAGALLALIGYWTILWFDKKGWNFKFRNSILMLSSLALLGGVYVKDLVYTPKPILIFYIDPFLFCGIVGALILIYSSVFYQWMKAKNGGHAHFPFEKVVLPIAALALASYAVDYVQLCAPEPSAQIEKFSSLPADGSDIYDFGN